MQHVKIYDTGIKGKALCQFEDHTLLVYRAGMFYLISSEKNVISKFSLPQQWGRKFWANLRIMERLLHIEPRWAYPLSQHRAYILYGAEIFKVNAINGKILSHEKTPTKGKPLNITRLEGMKEFKNSFVLGDYWTNTQRNSVNIYQKIDGEEEWKIAYTFCAKTVRHIHAIIPDIYSDVVYILTGDEDKESGIWIAKKDFSRVDPLIVGKQNYRACQLVCEKERLYYLSDMPSEKNFLYSIKTGTIKEIAPIRGSCIYGSNNFFSTTCEPDAHAKNKFDYWLTSKPGNGIIDNKFDILMLQNGTIFTLKSFEHDGLPLRLFQYATATFANSVAGEVFFTPVCVKKFDMHIFKIERE